MQNRSSVAQQSLRAIGYARVSSEGQRDNFSISAQMREIEQHCTGKGWSLEQIYVDEAKSAWTDKLEKRPRFRDLLTDMQHQLFDVIVVHSLDRWSRNLALTLQTFKEMNDHRVGFASVSESIDYSTAEGRLFIAMLGAFAQYYSDSLAKHTTKGIRERALNGFHLGGIPFGFVKCDCCEAGIHPVNTEAQAIAQLFEMYGSGTHTLAQLALWLNEQGFRTRNTKRLKDAFGNEVTGPQKFSIYSVRDILHNPFYAGLVTHRRELHPGKHMPVIRKHLFDTVQKQLKKARSQLHTTGAAYRTYLLKGLVRCVWCGLPLWGETLWHGTSYYRERKLTRGSGGCFNEGKSVRAEVLDGQVDKIMTSLELGSSWKERMRELASLGKPENIESQRQSVEQKLRRVGRAFIDGLIDDREYDLQQRMLRSHLDSLVSPNEEHVMQAGYLLENFPLLWRNANVGERHTILKGFVECVYVDVEDRGTVVGIKPKPQFAELFPVVNTELDSGVNFLSATIANEADVDLTGWWRRGGIEPPVQERPLEASTGVVGALFSP